MARLDPGTTKVRVHYLQPASNSIPYIKIRQKVTKENDQNKQ